MNRLKAIVILIVAAVSFAQCSTLKLTEKAPFTITEATYQNWVGGQPGVRGTNVTIGIEALNGISIQHVYYKNAKHIPSIETRKGKTYLVVNSTAARSDQIEEITLALKKNQDKRPEIKNEIPFALKINEAVIAYAFGKKTRYYKIQKIKKTETIFYP